MKTFLKIIGLVGFLAVFTLTPTACRDNNETTENGFSGVLTKTQNGITVKIREVNESQYDANHKSVGILYDLTNHTNSYPKGTITFAIKSTDGEEFSQKILFSTGDNNPMAGGTYILIPVNKTPNKSTLRIAEIVITNP